MFFLSLFSPWESVFLNLPSGEGDKFDTAQEDGIMGRRLSPAECIGILKRERDNGI